MQNDKVKKSLKMMQEDGNNLHAHRSAVCLNIPLYHHLKVQNSL